MKLQSIRGMRDILPEEQSYWEFAKSQFTNTASSLGFNRLDLPILEDLELFKRGIGESTDIVEKEMFVVDSSDEGKIALRPELTAGCLRAYLQNGFRAKPQPVLLYLIGQAYRHERPQKNRYREFWQLDLEVIGDDKPEFDILTIEACYRYLNGLGLKNIVVNLNSIGCKECRPNYRQILVDYLNSLGSKLCSDCLRRKEVNPLRTLDCKNPNCQTLLASAPKSVDNLCPACQDHFSTVQDGLNILEIKFLLTPNLVRGLDYYNRTVFEFNLINDESRQGSLGGGGRYDYLAESYDAGSLPAVGAALGLDRIVNALKQQSIKVPKIHSVKVAILSFKESQEEANQIYANLLKSGIYGRFIPTNSSLTKQLNEAVKIVASYAIIVGPDEIKSKTYQLKDLTAQKTEVLSLDDIIKRLNA